MDLPEIGYGTVNGRYLAGVLDSTDPAVAPDAEPLAGYVEFFPTASVILVGGAAPTPVTLMPQRVCVPLDAEGYLASPDTGSRDVTLFCTDDPDGNPIDWQWRAVFHLTYRGRQAARSPFNFELPCGTRVDLTTVSPVAEPSPGTIIIQGSPGEDGEDGEPGPPGPSALDLINAKGDLVGGTGDNAAAAIPVGQPGEYLTPEPTAETGLVWAPLPVPDAGLKAYASMAELDAVREPEVGVLHIADLRATFGPGLGMPSWLPPVPGDLVVTTSTEDAGFGGYTLIQNSLRVYADGNSVGLHVYRMRYADAAGAIGIPDSWHGAEFLPDPSAYFPSVVLQSDPTASFWQAQRAGAAANVNWFMQRDAAGRAQVVDPAVAADIATKGYVDGKVPAGGGGGLKVYATVADLDLIRTAEVGTLHVEDLGAAFPTLKSTFPALFPPYPADLLIYTSMNPQGANVRNFHQRFVLGEGGDYYRGKWFTRNMMRYGPTNGDWNGPPYNWRADAQLPPYPSQSQRTAWTDNATQGWVVGPYVSVPWQNFDSLAQRDSAGHLQVADPAGLNDAATKKYVDDAIAAAIAALP